MIAPLLLAAAVQVSPALPDTRRISVLQFQVFLPDTLDLPARRAAAALFARDTRTIRRCDDAVAIAGRYKAENRFRGTITMRNDVPLASFPPVLRREMLRVPTGHATRPFGTRGEVKVLVVCSAPKTPSDTKQTGPIV